MVYAEMGQARLKMRSERWILDGLMLCTSAFVDMQKAGLNQVCMELVFLDQMEGAYNQDVAEAVANWILEA